MDILTDKEMLMRAIDTLKKQQQKRRSKISENNLKQLFADDESNSREKVFLSVSLIKLPPIPKDGKTQPITIKSPIPHSFVDKFTNVLLITRDLKGNGRDYEPSVNEFKNKLRSHDALGLLSEIMTLRQLRTEYKDYELRRNLARQFDIVLCDKEIITKISHSLGKPFFSMNKRPIKVNLETKDLKESLEKSLSRSILHHSLEGSCSTVQIGVMNQTSEEIADNILSTMSTWKKLMIGGWENIRSINLKSETSKCLPLFVSTKMPKDIPKVVHPYVLKDDVIATDEVTTVDKPTHVVQVKRFGDVELVSSDTKKRKKYARRKIIEKIREEAKFDPTTNKIIKNGVVIEKKNRGVKLINRWVEKPKRERYFKNEMDTTTNSLATNVKKRNSLTAWGKKGKTSNSSTLKFKKGNTSNSSTTKFKKGLKAKRDITNKTPIKKISMGGRMRKSVIGAKTVTPNRKRTVQQPANSRRNKKRKVSEE